MGQMEQVVMDSNSTSLVFGIHISGQSKSRAIYTFAEERTKKMDATAQDLLPGCFDLGVRIADCRR